jgi:hypothetical protein
MLKPSETPRDGISRYWPYGCVWFSRIPNPSWWDAVERFQRCLEVILPASDKRLMSSERWVLNNFDRDDVERSITALDQKDELRGTDWRSGWVYFGSVPASRIKRVIHVVPVDTNGVEIEEARWYRQ